MDYAACNIIYVDRTADEDTLIKRGDVPLKLQDSNGSAPAQNGRLGGGKVRDVDCNVQTLLGTFSEGRSQKLFPIIRLTLSVHVCTTGSSCISKLTELNEASSVDLIPTLVLVDIPYEDHLDESKGPSVRTPSPMTSRVEDLGPDEVDEAFYGLGLLRWIALEIQQHNLPKLVVPVALVTIPSEKQAHPRSHELIPEVPRSGALKSHVANRLQFASVNMLLDQRRTMKYLDTGAVDVLTSPLLEERLPSLAIHAYRAHKESLKEHNDFLEVKRGRKRSWVGLDDQKPYAYLREAMVSGLMDGICRVGGDESPLSHVRLSVPVERLEKIENAIGSWYFSAHDFTDDELLHAALLILQHALDMPELEQWRVSTGMSHIAGIWNLHHAILRLLIPDIENLTGFLLACRGAYNAFVPYHNFRHVIDVLQAVFTFLIRIGTLPPYPIDSPPKSSPKSSIAQLLRPFDALTLLVTAIGHDVGHPGVNNAFLVTLNAPLAQLYNDRSVLESFHCAAYSQILRRHWPAAFQYVEMRQLMISSILATDMGLHFDYMKKLGFMQEKLHENGGTDGFNGRLLEEYRALACALLIKCADISNVVS
jgi:3',5'-cyclic-nucleotide phosphodiesterase